MISFFTLAIALGNQALAILLGNSCMGASNFTPGNLDNAALNFFAIFTRQQSQTAKYLLHYLPPASSAIRRVSTISNIQH